MWLQGIAPSMDREIHFGFHSFINISLQTQTETDAYPW